MSSADRRAPYLLSAAYAGANAPRGMPSAHRGGSTFTGKFQTKDGYVMVYVTNMSFWNRLVDLIAGDDDLFRERFTNVAVLGDKHGEFMAYLHDWFGTRHKVAIMEEAQARRIPLTAFLGMEELFTHDHFRGRGAFAAADHPIAGRLEYVGQPWRMKHGYKLVRPAPLLGEHTGEILKELGSPAGTRQSD